MRLETRLAKLERRHAEESWRDSTIEAKARALKRAQHLPPYPHLRAQRDAVPAPTFRPPPPTGNQKIDAAHALRAIFEAMGDSVHRERLFQLWGALTDLSHEELGPSLQSAKAAPRAIAPGD